MIQLYTAGRAAAVLAGGSVTRNCVPGQAVLKSHPVLQELTQTCTQQGCRVLLTDKPCSFDTLAAEAHTVHVQCNHIHPACSQLPRDNGDSAMRLLLVGKTGGGRSATGNTLLGRCAFESKLATKPVTLSCQKADGQWNGQDITVIDTADIFYLWDDNAQVHKEILHCIKLSSPGPHAVLLVTQLGRFTQEDQEAVQSVQDVFGSDVLRHTIVVFTRGEELVSGSLDDYVKYTDNKALRDVIRSCGYRYCSINNWARGAERDQQVQQLMEKIQQMVQENQGEYYSNEMYLDPRLMEETVKYHVKRYKEARKRREQDISCCRKYWKCLTVVGGGVILVAVVLSIFLTRQKP